MRILNKVLVICTILLAGCAPDRDAATNRFISGRTLAQQGTENGDKITNWTFSDSQRLIEVPVPVAQAADPDHVIELLRGVAAAHPLVIKDPAPQALVVNLGPGALSFELRASTDRAQDWMQIRSELAVAVKSVLAKENISIP